MVTLVTAIHPCATAAGTLIQSRPATCGNRPYRAHNPEVVAICLRWAGESPCGSRMHNEQSSEDQDPRSWNENRFENGLQNYGCQR